MLSKNTPNTEKVTFSLEETSKLKGVTYAHLNACSIRNKTSDLAYLTEKGKFDVLSISETHLDPTFCSSDYDIDGYMFHRLDRQDLSIKQSGGGICAYTRSCYNMSMIDELSLSDNSIEVLCLRHDMLNCRPVYIFNLYRPPSGNVKDFISKLAGILERCSERGNVELLAIGDMNINALSPCLPETRALYYFCNVFNLENCIKSPTRITSMTCIDLALSNRLEIIASAGTVAVIAVSATMN